MAGCRVSQDLRLGSVDVMPSFLDVFVDDLRHREGSFCQRGSATGERPFHLRNPGLGGRLMVDGLSLGEDDLFRLS